MLIADPTGATAASSYALADAARKAHRRLTDVAIVAIAARSAAAAPARRRIPATTRRAWVARHGGSGSGSGGGSGGGGGGARAHRAKAADATVK